MTACDIDGTISGPLSNRARPASYARLMTISSRRDQVRRVNDEIHSVLEQCGYHTKDVLAIRLALEEALVNAIKHGNALDPGKEVRVTYAVETERMWVRIEDEGAGFNVEEVPDPTQPENLERPSGRGILLMRAFMDSVEFRGGGRIVILRKERHRRKGGTNQPGDG